MKTRKITRFWTQKNGSKVRICDMTDSHLTNTINLIERNADRQRYDLPYPSFQGEMAQYFAESQFDYLMNANVEDLADDLCPEYKYLVKEFDRRKLKQ